ncbi:hypothetical protein PAXINDRAFT_14470 [Paxillus involutus ATCC 200175]|uniref:Uncharacterized protein n=1 Tax=Paxillus involutus ATCC 200175 TaxID=664439 RepID=A0A0C9TYW6_PAXIN|nr:hypothetical protein PAXINDRAFT_14470 [Paxillus involutus ATCC 200175]
MSARPRLPGGTSRGPPNGSNENEGEKGDRVERASGTVGPSSDDDGGDEGVYHRYIVPDSTPPPYPDEPTPPPPSTPLEGEMCGEESSGRAHEAATHDVETPRTKSRTTPPLQTPYDQRSSGEGRVLAIGHRQAVDAVHDPGGETDAPGSQPPSIRLEGEKDKASSLYVEVDHVETDDDHTQQPSRHPVGTTDGNERCPSEPTEPLDKKERERGVDGEVRGTSTVKEVEDAKSKSSRRVDEPGDDRDDGDESREVEDERGGQSEDDVCQQDGRTYDTGDATSSVNRNSKRVEAAPLADDKDGQQRNGKPDVTKHVPGPPTPHPSNTNQPTHHANPPRRHGRLKTLPTNVSQPEHTEYAPRQMVELTTTQANRMQRKQCRATGGVSQSHHSRGRRAPRPVHRHCTLSTSPIPPDYHIG